MDSLTAGLTINQFNSSTVEINRSNSTTVDVNQSNSAGVTTAGTYAASQGSASVTVN
jgi:hypothetical protein